MKLSRVEGSKLAIAFSQFQAAPPSLYCLKPLGNNRFRDEIAE